MAITDGGNGLEEALRTPLGRHLATVLDWYHAAEHLCDFAAVPGCGRDGPPAGRGRQGIPRPARGRSVADPSPCLGLRARALRCARGCGTDRLFREQPPSHGLSDVSVAGLGHRRRADRGGLQDHRRAFERLRDAPGGGRGGDRGCVTRLVRQQSQTLGRLLGATAPRGA